MNKTGEKEDKAYLGLSSGQAAARITRFGYNEIARQQSFSALKLLLLQFSSPLIYILLFAALITLFLGDFVDTGVIILAVMVNTVLGFYQENKAQRSLEALAESLSPQAMVRRNKKRLQIPAKQLVPGDLVYLSPGDKIPADGVLIQARSLRVSESILTGESSGVIKKSLSALKSKSILGVKMDAQALSGLEDIFTPVRKRIEEQSKGSGNESVYMGTLVQSGSAAMVVVHTGEKTEVGGIALSLSLTEDEETPLQHRLSRFSRVLAVFVGLVALSILGAGLLAGNSFTEIFTLSVAVAVAAIPEGLAISLTAILAVGMQRILKKKALVRKLVAAEVLGSVSVICVDKTGTLTEGVMKVTKAVTIDKDKLRLVAVLGNLLKDPIEIGMWEWARDKFRSKNYFSLERLMRENPVDDELLFRPDLRYKAILSQKEVLVTGAPEVLLASSRLSKKAQKDWQKQIEDYARKGLRVVGFAYKPYKEKRLSQGRVMHSLNWLGFLVYQDPVRKGVKTALLRARQAGMRVKVITGDYRETAKAVMLQLGLKLKDNQIMQGVELANLSVDQLQRRLKEVVLFARTTPEQKHSIVKALQKSGEVVAMTGDGVNDAPALKKADVGVVVSSASDVSKETADMVLLDDNFATIISAVEEGRGIFTNLRKVLLYLLSDSFTEVIIVLGALILRLPLPITAVQILWVNLVDDGLPNLALTVDPHEKGLLRNKPRRRKEPLLDLEIKVLIGLISVVTAIAVLVVFSWYSQYDLVLARTMAFTILGIDSLLYVFSSRSLSQPLWRSGIGKNPWLIKAVLAGFVIQISAIYVPFLQKVLGTVPLNLAQWGVVAISGLIVISVIEIVKWVFLKIRR